MNITRAESLLLATLEEQFPLPSGHRGEYFVRGTEHTPEVYRSVRPARSKVQQASRLSFDPIQPRGFEACTPEEPKKKDTEGLARCLSTRERSVA